MRTLPSSNAPTPATPTTTTTAAVTQPQRSPWHSPVPYLFGGLAAMLGLIAFALLILACSYWNLSGRAENDNQNGGDREGESGKRESDGGKGAKIYEEKILVIMAGDERPTFLATPVCSKASSFADGKEMNKNEEGEKMEVGEKVKENVDH